MRDPGPPRMRVSSPLPTPTPSAPAAPSLSHGPAPSRMNAGASLKAAHVPTQHPSPQAVWGHTWPCYRPGGDPGGPWPARPCWGLANARPSFWSRRAPAPSPRPLWGSVRRGDNPHREPPHPGLRRPRGSCRGARCPRAGETPPLTSSKRCHGRAHGPSVSCRSSPGSRGQPCTPHSHTLVWDQPDLGAVGPAGRRR